MTTVKCLFFSFRCEGDSPIWSALVGCGIDVADGLAVSDEEDSFGEDDAWGEDDVVASDEGGACVFEGERATEHQEKERKKVGRD